MTPYELNKKPLLVQIPGKESGDRWKLVGYMGAIPVGGEPWVYQFVLDGNLYRMKIPCGFASLDGASVPRWIDWLVKMGGRNMPDEAWVPHDFGYKRMIENGMFLPGEFQMFSQDSQWQDMTFVKRLFLDRMIQNELENPWHGLSSYKAPLAFRGLRAAFWKEW